MTEDRALARIIELDGLDDAERRVELRKVLSRLRSNGWNEGYNEGASDAW